ncbi:MAG TPA: MFS transporter [Xanthobacteraceae bacterium]|nr:MFS transporter [Xanthobacteraceae bacterium]
MTTAEVRTPAATWRTPLVVILCGCAIAMVAFGPRSALGQFLTPLSQSHGWGRDVFSLAIAVQNLLWGAGQPIAGAIADKYGAPWVLSAGAVMYAAGLILTAYADTAVELHISAGLLIGFALSCSSFSLVIGALGKLVPPQWRMLAFGAGTAAGSFGQFLFSPLARVLIDQVGWQQALVTFGFVVLLILPLSLAMATPRADDPVAGAPAHQTAKQALMEALGHRSYNLLVLGFFTCGFQLAFVTVHLPSYLLDRGLSADVGAITIGVIGLFNIAGSLGAGWLSGIVPKRFVLSGIYATRGAAIVAFILLPATPASAIVFGAVTGLVWLATVPPTNGLVALMFGTRWLSMLAGFAFLSHQIGGFLGVWLGGFVFERTGSYDLVWWLSIGFCIMSALVNLPIVEKPVVRTAMAPA